MIASVLYINIYFNISPAHALTFIIFLCYNHNFAKYIINLWRRAKRNDQCWRKIEIRMNSLIHKLVQMKIAAELVKNQEAFDEKSLQLVEQAKAKMGTLTKKEELEMAC